MSKAIVRSYGSSSEEWRKLQKHTLKRTYNVDENRIVVSGVSDGGTGAYYIAMRETTPFASFLPLNGFVMVLTNEEIDDGRLFPNNLVNKPWFIVNGGQDRLYPTANVEPFIRHMMNKGVDLTYHARPEAGHNTAWWSEEKYSFEQFVLDHPRRPHPDTLTWQAADASYNRAHWLIIDKLGAQSDDANDMRDVNIVGESEPVSKFGFLSLFNTKKASGRIDISRIGNTVQVTTRGVAEFTLLLSPDIFDFRQPITVLANSRIVFHGAVQRSLETLLKWAARDNDRTMLYGAELNIRLSR